MPSIQLRFNVGRVRSNMEYMKARVDRALIEAVEYEADMIYRMSQLRVPIETPLSPYYKGATAGTLKRSGEVIPVGRYSRTIAYGRLGLAHQYALAVHEHLSQHSPPSWQGKGTQKTTNTKKRRKVGTRVTFYTPGTGPKYLEGPFKHRTAGMEARVASRVKSRVLKGG